MTLTEALDLADCVSPAPADAHQALLVLRQHLADACAMDVAELRTAAPAYERAATSEHQGARRGQ